jgi:hypothetical protein
MFAPWFPPHRNSEAHTTGNLVLAMLKKGWHVDVISEPRYDLADKTQLLPYWIKLAPHCYPICNKQQSAIFNYTDKVKALLKMKNPIRGISWSLYAFEKAIKLHKINNYNITLLSKLPQIRKFTIENIAYLD